MKIKLDNNEIDVKIIYKNNRNIYFRFNENGVLIVTCPHRTSDREIVSLIQKNEPALLKMYQKNAEKQKYEEEFWLLGKKYQVVIDEDTSETQINGENIYASSNEELEQFIAIETQRVFQEEIDICRNCFRNLPEFTLKIRKMKTRWGVCNRRNNTITLNSELIKKETDLIDYVIIHEMAHFYEGNHSKKFWNIVALACPKYKECRKRLR